MAAKRIIRSNDPVRVYDDARVVWWDGGRPGVGVRHHQRFNGDMALARQEAEKIREELRWETGMSRLASATLNDLMQDLLRARFEEGGAASTRNQYASNWNKWVPDEVKVVRCLDARIEHWSMVFRHLGRQGASLGTIKAVTRTLNSVITHGCVNGFLPTEDAWGPKKLRDKVAADTRRRAVGPTPAANGQVSLDDCPTVAEIEALAQAMEVEYPGYGSRLVMLAFTTGLRRNELLALRVDSINLETGEIRVESQLDRLNHFPAVKLPKNQKTRTAIIWDAYLDIARSLVEDATSREEDNGWLFPRYRSTTGWSDRLGKMVTDASRRCGWEDRGFHWLRHAWASYSLAPRTYGGYELDPKAVSGWLGHADLSITLNMYVQRQSDAAARARQLTSRPPGSASVSSSTI